jgi:hypothetical protein
MNLKTKGNEIFLSGLMISLATYYLEGLDMGNWLPLVVCGVQVGGFVLMFIGMRQWPENYKNFKVAMGLIVAEMGIYLLFFLVLVGSMGSISPWEAVTGSFLALTGAIIYLVLMGMVFQGLARQYQESGDEPKTKKIRTLWWWFFAFATVSLILRIGAVALVNQSWIGLTYLLPMVGIPVLIIGGLFVKQLWMEENII